MRFADIRSLDPSSIALQGFEPADVQFEAATSRIAAVGENSADGANVDVVDLSAEMVALMSARNLFDLDLATLESADQMQKSPGLTWKARRPLLTSILGVLSALFSANSAVQASR